MTIQNLIDTGLWLTLEGSVGRQCSEAIQAGYAMLPEKAQTDYWGNRVPSRYEVTPGEPGSEAFYEATQADVTAGES